MEINAQILENMIRDILKEKLCEKSCGVKKIPLKTVQVSEENRLNTGNNSHKVYTKDIFDLEESPRLGCGIMEMENTTFDWTLSYDEIDYIIEGRLTVITETGSVTAEEGEIILIPKNSKIKFSVEGKSRFLYVTYPANWQNTD